MKHIIVAIGVFILGFILIGLANGLWGNGNVNSLYGSIIIAILYLAAVLSCAVSILIAEINKNRE